MEEPQQPAGNPTHDRLMNNFESQSRKSQERRSHHSGASESSAKSVSVIEQTIFSFLTTFRFVAVIFLHFFFYNFADLSPHRTSTL